jgi:hypothetical protein
MAAPSPQESAAKELASGEEVVVAGGAAGSSAPAPAGDVIDLTDSPPPSSPEYVG